MLQVQSGHVVSAVPTNLVDEAWPIVEKWIAEALQYQWGFKLADVRAKILQGFAILWIIEREGVIKGAFVTEVISYPRTSSLNVWLLAGEEFNYWKAGGLAAIEMFARHNACEFIEFSGRPGLKRLLADLGFSDSRTVCVKRVDPLTH